MRFVRSRFDASQLRLHAICERYIYIYTGMQGCIGFMVKGSYLPTKFEFMCYLISLMIISMDSANAA